MLQITHSGFFFVVLISVVVIIHEFGHFIVARLNGVRVEAFSLFFGKPIFKWKRGETEWRIGMIPFGGYVKMVGQSDLDAVDEENIDEELKGVSFAHKSLWAKASIVAAGPISNLILALVIFSCIFFAGYPTATTLIGSVDKDGVAYEAGVRPGDRVVAIDGREMWRWEDMAKLIKKSPGKPLTFSIERGDSRFDAAITPKLRKVKNIFQFDADAGVIGVSQDGYLPIAGISDPESPAGKAGLWTGDLIKKINGSEIHYFTDVDRVLSQSGGPFEFVIERGGLALAEQERKPVELSFTVVSAGSVNRPADIGLERADLYIHQTVADDPAAAAGLRGGDRLYAINGKPLKDWDAFTVLVRLHPEEKLDVTVVRDGRKVEIPVTPKMAREKNMLGDEEEFGRVGIYPWLSYSLPEIKEERYFNPLKAFSRGLEMTVDFTALTIKGFFYVITGDVSIKSLGGPIMIANLAGESAKGGLLSFIWTIAIISLNLAIINILPIPVLDGGHLLLFGIEGIRRKPLSPAKLQIAMKIGLFLVGMLVIAVFYNDISRYVPGLRSLFGLWK